MNIVKIIEDEGEFKWSTPYGHPDNTFTMNEFLETYLPEEFIIFDQDGSRADVSRGDGRYYS